MIVNASIIDTDVLIIGGGGAAARAAIAADTIGTKTLMVVKGVFGCSGCTPIAMGGLAATLGSGDPRDSWEVHFRDTCIGGGMLNNQKLVEILCRSAGERFKELESYGSLFDRKDGQGYFQRQLGGHTYARTCISGDRTGGEMMRGLHNEVLRREIKTINDCMALKLLTEEGRVVGCVAHDMRKGSFLVFKAKVVILACGGSGQVFKYCIAPQGKVGDANRMALEVGAELVDMEVFQFHPTSYKIPESLAGLLITEAARSEGGRLFNIHGERFMERYNPKQLELACRDFMSRCIYFEVQEGRGTKDGGVYLSMTHLPARIIEDRLNTLLMRGLNDGIDIRKEPLVVYPSAHYQNGGVRVGTSWESTMVKNLYVCGESAGGVQGGNRLGSNSLPDLLVSGRIAGEAAARAALSGNCNEIGMTNFNEQVAKAEKEISEATEIDNGVNPIAIRNEIKELAWDYVGIARNEKKLKHALDTLDDIKRHRLPQIGSRIGAYNINFIEAMDIRSMVVSVEVMARAALMRIESRCGHFREDYPFPDKDWTANIVIHQDKDGEYVLTKTPIVKTILDPGEVELPEFPVSGKIER